jgi:glycosyltransferase involved in cell wall biosynthesis
VKVLFVTPRYPWPPRRGDQLRTVQWLALLAPRHELTLLCPRPARSQEVVPPPPCRVAFCDRTPGAAAWGLALALARGLPLQSGLFFQPDLGRKLRRLAPEHDVVVLQLARLVLHAGDLGSTPVVVDLIDSLALNLERRAAVDRAWLRPLLAWEARALRRAERKLAEQAAAVTLVCARDRRWLAEALPAALGAKLSVVPLVVPAAEARPDRQEGPPLLALTGNLGYFVNRDAVVWWLTRVWPQLSRVRPEVRVLVAGDRPGRTVRRAVARAGPRVSLVAAPDDLGALLARASLALAPLRSGSGVPVKILEAWAHGVPVVASPWAAAGAAAEPGRDLLVAQEPEDWVRAVSTLLDDRDLRTRLAAAGRARLAVDCSESAAKEQLDKVFLTVLRRDAAADS